MDDVQRRQQRLDRARVLVHTELALAFAVPLIAAFLFVAAPGTMCCMYLEPPLVEVALPWAAAAGVPVGILWMIRLSRPDPEPGERSWRYRDF
ncbi:MAG TPA: hypothetical protein VM408_07380 [Methylomirabilota bacterium]|nr:hypothetical protein [Methylomirabilota bacterium]